MIIIFPSEAFMSDMSAALQPVVINITHRAGNCHNASHRVKSKVQVSLKTKLDLEYKL